MKLTIQVLSIFWLSPFKKKAHKLYLRILINKLRIRVMICLH